VIAEDGTDFTHEFLDEPGYELWLFLKDGYEEGEWNPMLQVIMKSALQKNIPGFILTNISVEKLREESPELVRLMFPLRSDVTAVKTAGRTNPTLYLVKQGTILNKWGMADFEMALVDLQKVPANVREEIPAPATDSIPAKDSSLKK